MRNDSKFSESRRRRSATLRFFLNWGAKSYTAVELSTKRSKRCHFVYKTLTYNKYILDINRGDRVKNYTNLQRYDDNTY